MATKAITLRSIEALAAGETIWDGGKEAVKGFGARRQVAGISYILKYRFQGRQRFFTIGRHGAGWTPDLARKQAREVLGHINGGEDPASKKAADREEQTFAQFWQVYREDYGVPFKKPRTVKNDDDLYRLHLAPPFGPMKLRQITQPDIARLHRSLSKQPYGANRMLALIRHMFTMAAKWGYVPKGWENPAWDIEPYPEKKRERRLTTAEMKRLGEALQKAETGWTAEEAEALPQDKRPERLDPEPWQSIALFRLLLLTGARFDEIRTLHWSYIDFERGVARLPDSKTGAKNLPLPPPALELLVDLPRLKNNDFVLPGKKKNKPYVQFSKPWLRVRKLADLLGLRLNDLRHSYASVAVANNESLYIVGAVLGHRHASTTQRYAHLASDPVTQLADRNAARIAGLLNATPSAEIVPLKRGRKR